MSIQVRIPTPLRRLTENQASIAATGQDVQAVLDHVEREYPGFKEALRDESGSLKRFINIYVNGEEIRSLDGEETLVNEGDEISIIPAIAGGVWAGDRCFHDERRERADRNG